MCYQFSIACCLKCVATHVVQIPVAEVWAVTTDPAVGYGFTWACTCCSPSFNEQVRWRPQGIVL